MPGRKAVHFGAGNIGRGFIGLMLSRSGYEVCFVARNEKQVALLKQDRRYKVTLVGESEKVEMVENVTAVHLKNGEAVRQRIADADLVTTAVGESALPHIARSIAEGIAMRLRVSDRQLQVVACENAVKGSSKLKKWVYSHLKEEEREQADRQVSFPNAIVDRIVPPQSGADSLGVRVEPFCEWVLEKDPLRGGTEDIAGVRYVESLEPYAERKLYTVNVGHCGAAYFGYLAGYGTIGEALEDSALRRKVESVLEETGRLLVHKHNWNAEEHRQYIRRSMQRFSNPSLVDKVTRVGRSPLRKTSAGDRLVRPAVLAEGLGMDVPHLTQLLSAALLFDYDKDPEAMQLQQRISENGVRDVIRNHMGIRESQPLHFRIAEQYELLKEAASR
ncbi:mannitol-1-phosphate 5-dehydrogenase [Cohnella fermenti]|uniref:Mannitol-1-phosphate 5-dehydrogenase n=1 Tax=Cohnella fermenti TaxID=2565925 RepID=A0A4S4BSR7_9BACL|nr:mannitol-1-phosphate 5-dehydrogenase [Cohnella fermenti]THF78058.1 mannitol-1-phosphate 5-dehydrogenase [Cohnella fermenti]